MLKNRVFLIQKFFALRFWVHLLPIRILQSPDFDKNSFEIKPYLKKLAFIIYLT